MPRQTIQLPFSNAMTDRQTADTTARRDKTIVVVLSTMRSGSTLLKALLGSLPDTSHLPEIDFQKYQGPKALSEIESLSEQPIITLKRPAWFNETNTYPKLPAISGFKKLILVRDVGPNVLSLRKMAFRKLEKWIPESAGIRMGTHYWAKVYGNLIERFPKEDPSNFWIRYEDILENPIERTHEMFAFLGSENSEGIDRYDRPTDYKWKWGTDDGGPNIKSLTVQKPKPPSQKLIELTEKLNRNQAVREVRQALGYL